MSLRHSNKAGLFGSKLDVPLQLSLEPFIRTPLRNAEAHQHLAACAGWVVTSFCEFLLPAATQDSGLLFSSSGTSEDAVLIAAG